MSPSVQSDARRLLTPKQVFKLKGGVVGAIRTISYNTGLLTANSDIKRLSETGSSSYEAYERLAVLSEPSQIRQKIYKQVNGVNCHKIILYAISLSAI